jgi:uncharacterized protein (TIGR03437 family)
VFVALGAEPRGALVYSTYLGGSKADVVTDLRPEPDGGVVVTGVTASTDLPFPPGVTRPEGEFVAFLLKLSGSGDRIEWVRFPNLPDGPWVLRFGADGSLYAYGQQAAFVTLELTPGAVDLNDGLYGQSYLIKLDATGERVLAVARVTGYLRALTTDRAGNIYLAGEARPGFPITAGAAQPRTGGGVCTAPRRPDFPCPDALVMKLNATLTRVEYSTFLGGSAEDSATAIAVHDDGSVVVTGQTLSGDFPTTVGALQRTFRGRVTLGPVSYGDAFVAKLDVAGRRFGYSTYLGGAAADDPRVVKLDAEGNAYVAGGTESLDFPVSTGAYQSLYGGPFGQMPSGVGDGFVVKLSPAGQLRFGTYLGGPRRESIGMLAVDGGGNIYLNAAPLPDLNPPSRPRCRNPQQPELSMLDARGSAIQLLHGRTGPLMAVDRQGVLYTGGGTFASHAGFATAGAYQTRYGGGGDNDGFVSKVIPAAEPLPGLHCVANAASLVPGQASQLPDGTIAPGEIVSLFGTKLDGAIRLLFDGREAPLLYVSASQVNAIVPFGIVEPLTKLTIEVVGKSLGVLELPVSPVVPGIFTLDGSGSGQAAALNEDGSVNSPENPAAAGSVIAFWATGAGAMTPVQRDGEVTPLEGPWPAPTLGVSVSIGGRPAEVLYAGAAPGLVAGVIQVNARIPVETHPWFSAALWLNSGSYPSQAVTIAVK